MSNVKIKAEKLAERCEICHQKDCFDATKNYCYRCAKIQNIEFNKNRKITNRFKNLIPTLEELLFKMQQDRGFSLSNSVDKFSWKMLTLYFAEIYVYPLFRISLIVEILVYLSLLITLVLVGLVVLTFLESLIVLFGGIFIILFFLGFVMSVLYGINDLIKDVKTTNSKYNHLNEDVSEDN